MADPPPVDPSTQDLGATLRQILKPSSPPSFFEVKSKHGDFCDCPRCSQKPLPFVKYNRSIHWSWQTNTHLHQWTPEIYECRHFSITIIREESVKKIDLIKQFPKKIYPYLRFEFEVEIRLRELGWCRNFFKPASIPPDIRSKTDSGQPLPPDRAKFCIMSCSSPEIIYWPYQETLDMQEAVDEQVG
jgi:hypothetical protein